MAFMGCGWLGLALALAALFASPSVAAQPHIYQRQAFELCGPSGCERIVGRTNYETVVGLLAVAPDPSGHATPPPIAPFYEIRVELSRTETDRGFFVPASQVLKPPLYAGEPGWIRATPEALEVLAPAMRAISPWPAPQITDARVGGRVVADPSFYSALYDELPKAPPGQGVGTGATITLQSDRSSPWTYGFNTLKYFPDDNVLYRGGEWVQLPPAISERLKQGGGLKGPEGTSGMPWELAVISVLGVLALASLAAALFHPRGPLRRYRKWLFFPTPSRLRRQAP